MLSKILSIFKRRNNKKDAKKSIGSKSYKIIEIDYIKCKNCLSCYRACKNNVFDIENSRIVVKNEKNCTKCGDCVKSCRYGAIILYE